MNFLHVERMVLYSMLISERTRHASKMPDIRCIIEELSIITGNSLFDTFTPYFYSIVILGFFAVVLRNTGEYLCTQSL